MSQPCTTCGDTEGSRRRSREEAIKQAKKIAIEKGQAQANCKDEINGTYYVLDAATAFREHHLIDAVVSGLPD